MEALTVTHTFQLLRLSSQWNPWKKNAKGGNSALGNPAEVELENSSDHLTVHSFQPLFVV